MASPALAVRSKKATSSIAMALAGQAASMKMPKPSVTMSTSDSAVDDGDMATEDKGKQAGLLPTPPNSISPSLHPNALKGRDMSVPLTPPANGPESDIDLQEAVEHAAAQSLSTLDQGRLRALDSTSAITPTLLATHHLPDILLAHGPLAIRHIMGYLTTSVPGFSGIPSTKARRLVVGALEGRGGASGEATGGVDGEVVFEKVGWGKWDAHAKGQPSRNSQRQVSPLAYRQSRDGDFRSESPNKARSPAPRTMRIPHRPRHHQHRGRLPSTNSMSHSHQSSHLAPFYDETEADRMSLDDASELSGEEPIDYTAAMDEEGEETDEEDWCGMGAAALRANSLPKNHRHKPVKRIDYNAREIRRPSYVKQLARSAPHPASAALERHRMEQAKAWEQLKHKDKETLDGVDADDAEAVRALLQLGSH